MSHKERRYYALSPIETEHLILAERKRRKEERLLELRHVSRQFAKVLRDAVSSKRHHIADFAANQILSECDSHRQIREETLKTMYIGVMSDFAFAHHEAERIRAEETQKAQSLLAGAVQHANLTRDRFLEALTAERERHQKRGAIYDRFIQRQQKSKEEERNRARLIAGQPQPVLQKLKVAPLHRMKMAREKYGRRKFLQKRADHQTSVTAESDEHMITKGHEAPPQQSRFIVRPEKTEDLLAETHAVETGQSRDKNITASHLEFTKETESSVVPYIQTSVQSIAATSVGSFSSSLSSTADTERPFSTPVELYGKATPARQRQKIALKKEGVAEVSEVGTSGVPSLRCSDQQNAKLIGFHHYRSSSEGTVVAVNDRRSDAVIPSDLAVADHEHLTRLSVLSAAPPEDGELDAARCAVFSSKWYVPDVAESEKVNIAPISLQPTHATAKQDAILKRRIMTLVNRDQSTSHAKQEQHQPALNKFPRVFTSPEIADKHRMLADRLRIDNKPFYADRRMPESVVSRSESLIEQAQQMLRLQTQRMSSADIVEAQNNNDFPPVQQQHSVTESAIKKTVLTDLPDTKFKAVKIISNSQTRRQELNRFFTSTPENANLIASSAIGMFAPSVPGTDYERNQVNLSDTNKSICGSTFGYSPQPSQRSDDWSSVLSETTWNSMSSNALRAAGASSPTPSSILSVSSRVTEKPSGQDGRMGVAYKARQSIATRSSRTVFSPSQHVENTISSLSEGPLADESLSEATLL